MDLPKPTARQVIVHLVWNEKNIHLSNCIARIYRKHDDQLQIATCKEYIATDAISRKLRATTHIQPAQFSFMTLAIGQNSLQTCPSLLSSYASISSALPTCNSQQYQPSKAVTPADQPTHPKTIWDALWLRPPFIVPSIVSPHGWSHKTD